VASKAELHTNTTLRQQTDKKDSFKSVVQSQTSTRDARARSAECPKLSAEAAGLEDTRYL